MKKLMSLLLVLSLFVLPINLSFAESKLQYEKYVDIEINGKVYSILVTSNFPFEDAEGIKPQHDSSPKYNIGSIKEYSFVITREQLDLAENVTKVSAKLLGKIASQAVPYVNGVAIIASLGAGTMAAVGINGIRFHIKLRYAEFNHYKDGYTEYDWSIDGIRLETI